MKRNVYVLQTLLLVIYYVDEYAGLLANPGVTENRSSDWC